MTSLFKRRTARRQKNMEGVNMPASPKLAWRWIVGTTAAAMLFVATLPSVGHAETLKICISNNGKIKGVNVDCGGTEISWETVGPQGDQGLTGVDGASGFAGAQGAAGPPGIPGTNGAQGLVGPTGDPGVAGGIGDQGPQGIQGNPGIPGIPGLKGPTGIPGINGGTELSISFLTGGSLGSFGREAGVGLSGLNSISGLILALGPGNGSDDGSDQVTVPMNDPGTAYNLFVGVDNHPGTSFKGTPINYFFFLCQNNFIGTCNVACVITDPDTTCSDLKSNTGDVNTYAQGDTLGLFAFSDDILANAADVTWSTTYQHNTFVAP